MAIINSIINIIEAPRLLLGYISTDYCLSTTSSSQQHNKTQTLVVHHYRHFMALRNEPGVTTAPAISTDIAPDEQDIYATTTTNEDDMLPGVKGIAASAGVRTDFTAVPYHSFGASSLLGASENLIVGSKPSPLDYR
ncbi:hypothetical protein N431DRAFT_473577 [Stipitochalara longipes BDJ]|nr:hypothetical protein N431DRAFT_473577 [Stipitochalara longipes BDJ]